MKLLAIDPGNEQSALLVYDTEAARPEVFGVHPNEAARSLIVEAPADELAIEMVASYGMAVGATVFETCVWAGRFMECWLGAPGFRPHPIRVYRREVKLHLCGSARAKDPNVRQALIDRYGPSKEQAIGRKASPGPLYGLSRDCWAALAVAVTVAETSALTPKESH